MLLFNKDMNSFWKCWKSKFSRKKVSQVCLQCDPSVIAEMFANMFKTACSPNSAERDSSLKSQFGRNFATYDCGISNGFSVNVELVDRCINKLKRGKAAGLDGLTSEHLLYVHPVVVTLITHLFKLIFQCGIVPTGFGCGVIIPLVKNSDGDMTSSENYRGITLSPVISKLFELVLMEMVGEKLTSSPLQFVYKANSNCSHAILGSTP